MVTLVIRVELPVIGIGAGDDTLSVLTAQVALLVLSVGVTPKPYFLFCSPMLIVCTYRFRTVEAAVEDFEFNGITSMEVLVDQAGAGILGIAIIGAVSEILAHIAVVLAAVAVKVEARRIGTILNGEKWSSTLKFSMVTALVTYGLSP